jgi:c-di-GMP-binding flagellar brake protein YcgR
MMTTKGTGTTEAGLGETTMPSGISGRTAAPEHTNPRIKSGSAKLPADSRERSFTFSEMKLVVGDRLQVQCQAHHNSPRVFVKMVGYVENISLIVTAPSRNGVRLQLLETDTLIVRAFARQNAFAFKCSVLRVCTAPFHYLHLSFPEQIQGSMIRKSARVWIGVPSEVAGKPSGSVVIENISATGALVLTDKPLGRRGDILRMSFRVNLHDIDSRLDVDAEILTGFGTEDDTKHSYRHGVEFRNLKPEDLLVLKSLIYQQMIENPTSVL